MGTRWAVLIGINGYHESLGPLNYSVNDAMLMQETLTSECCGFSPENIILLTDDQPHDRQPTFGNIHSWLGTWLSRPEPDDLVLIYFAGHGREMGDQALLAPVDATLEALPVTGIPIQYLRELLDRCQAKQKVLIMDACHSGAGRDVATMSMGFRDALDVGKGLYTIASCDADQISYEWPEKEHGVFTQFLCEAILHGAAVDTDGRVSLDRVYELTRSRILDWTIGKRLKQEPVRICRTKGDIHIATRPLNIKQQFEAAKAHICQQEETIHRLRKEVETLAEENKKLLDQNKQLAAPRTQRRAIGGKRVTPQEWKTWVAIAKREPYGFDALDIRDFALGGLMGAIVGLLTGAVFSLELHTSDAMAWLAGVLAGVLAGLMFGPGPTFIIWLMTLRKWKNKYRLYCLQECVKGRDVVGALAYAGSMGRLGIDLGTGAAALCEVAELAVDLRLVDDAKALYETAQHRWKSPHAERALKALSKQ